MSEEWRAVVGYEGVYDVSSCGNVASRRRFRARGGRLKPFQAGGYPSVKLVVNGLQRTRYVHHLVAEAFLGPRPDGAVIRHRDGDYQNPAATNLTYGTMSENQYDSVHHGTQHNTRKTHCPAGHEYDEANTYVLPSRPTARYCRECSRRRGQARRAARRGVAA